MYREHVCDFDKSIGDCSMKWLIMFGFMDLRGPRVSRRPTSVLLSFVGITSWCLAFTEKTSIFISMEAYSHIHNMEVTGNFRDSGS